MNYPEPYPGLVVRYRYLWRADELEGFSEGDKERPCAIVLASKASGEVTLIPITHSPPDIGEDHLSIEIPIDICKALGLDDAGSYVRLGETNRFVWPGRHLAPLPFDPSRVHYGMLPEDFFKSVMDAILKMVKSKQKITVTKTS